MADEMQMDPEMIKALMALQGQEDEAGDVNAQLAFLRRQKMQQKPTGPIQAGQSTVIAANPLQHLADGVQNYQNGMGMKNAQAQIAALRQQQTQGRQAYGAAYLQNQAGMPPAGP